MGTVTPLTVPIAILVLFALVLRRRQRLVAASAQNPAMAHRDAITIRARGIGVLAALALLAVHWAVLGSARTAYSGAAVFALAIAVALLLAELRTWRAAQTVGLASLETRPSTHYLPRALLALTAVAAAGLVGLLLWAASHQDSSGRGWIWTSPDGLSSGGGSPFPGTWYSVPMAIALAMVGIASVAGIVVTLRRPRNGADPVVVQVDDDARRHSSEAFVACLALAVFGCLFMALLTSGSALQLFVTPPRTPGGEFGSRYTAWAVGMVTSILLLLGTWALAVLLVPGTTREVH